MITGCPLLKMKRFILYVLVILPLFNMLFFSEALCAETSEAVIDVESSVTVKNGDGAQAHRDAVESALQKAVEQATAGVLTPEIMRDKARLLKEKIFLKADQYIQDYRIIDKRADYGVYTLTVRITVSPELIKSDLRALGFAKELPRGTPAAPVTITLHGIKTYGDYARFREYVKTGLKGVEEVRQRSMAWGTAGLEADIQGGAAALAAELSKIKQIPIKTKVSGENAVEVIFIK